MQLLIAQLKHCKIVDRFLIILHIHIHIYASIYMYACSYVLLKRRFHQTLEPLQAAISKSPLLKVEQAICIQSIFQSRNEIVSALQMSLSTQQPTHLQVLQIHHSLAIIEFLIVFRWTASACLSYLNSLQSSSRHDSPLEFRIRATDSPLPAPHTPHSLGTHCHAWSAE